MAKSKFFKQFKMAWQYGSMRVIVLGAALSAVWGTMTQEQKEMFPYHNWIGLALFIWAGVLRQRPSKNNDQDSDDAAR